MSFPLNDNTGRFEREVDRHVTGNYGEDYFKDEDEEVEDEEEDEDV